MSHGPAPDPQHADAVAKTGRVARRWTPFVLGVLGVLVLVGLLPRLVGLAVEDPLSDVRAYYAAAERLNAGLPLYPAEADVNASEFYRYPPLLAIAFRPLAAGLPFESAAWVWEALTVVAFALTIRMLARRPGFLPALGILAFPIAWSLLLGQAQVVVTFLTALASPLAIALAGQLKLFPALVVIYFIGIRDWRWLRRFAAWSVGLVALQVVLEPRGFMDFLGVVNLQQVGQINNLSIYSISPMLWALACVAGAAATLWLAPKRYGWAFAVVFSVVSTPRLLSYLLMATLAAVRTPPGATRQPEAATTRDATHATLRPPSGTSASPTA